MLLPNIREQWRLLSSVMWHQVAWQLHIEQITWHHIPEGCCENLKHNNTVINPFLYWGVPMLYSWHWDHLLSMRSFVIFLRTLTELYVYVTMHCNKFFFIIKPTRWTHFPNLLQHETLHVSGSSSAHHQEFIIRQLLSRTRMELQ
jgi:hypothetical protein